MEYRIENGEARIPISEVNRLNDEAEKLKEKERELEKREIELEKREIKLNKRIESEVAVFYSHNNPWGKPLYYVADNEKAEKITQSIRSEVAESKKRALANIAEMSIWEFIKWRKS